MVLILLNDNATTSIVYDLHGMAHLHMWLNLKLRVAYQEHSLHLNLLHLNSYIKILTHIIKLNFNREGNDIWKQQNWAIHLLMSSVYVEPSSLRAGGTVSCTITLVLCLTRKGYPLLNLAHVPRYTSGGWNGSCINPSVV